MRIGKTVTVITSPRRNIRKAGEKQVPYREDEKPIPVEVPNKTRKKAPEKVEV